MNSPLSQFSSHLFWDINKEDLDLDLHSSFITERVLSKGTIEDFKLLFTFMDEELITSNVKKLQGLDPKTANFAHIYFDIPKNEMKCYGQKRSTQEHWNY